MKRRHPWKETECAVHELQERERRRHDPEEVVGTHQQLETLPRDVLDDDVDEQDVERQVRERADELNHAIGRERVQQKPDDREAAPRIENQQRTHFARQPHECRPAQHAGAGSERREGHRQDEPRPWHFHAVGETKRILVPVLRAKCGDDEQHEQVPASESPGDHIRPGT